ncbi:MAG: hypothetical protein ACLQBP_01735 [Methanoregula sp.]|uniref:hypothetical protein n=3 Tax=Methanoregula sp. TaxID=2052170 RepID=UPI003BEC40F0
MKTLVPDMEPAAVMKTLRLACSALGWCVILAFVLPLGAAYLLGLSPVAAGALIASAFVIEDGSIPIGIGLGLPVQYVVPVATSVEAGIFLGLFGIFDAIGTASGHVAAFLDWTRRMTARSWMFERYGIYGLVPAEILIGVYLCSPASWLFGWQKWRSFAITMAGYCVSAAAITLATLGFIHYFLPLL